MKKLMIMAAAIAISAIANAATVSWSATGIVAAPELTDRSTYMAYLFDTSAGFDNITSAIASGDMTALNQAIGTKKVTSTGSISMAKTSDIAAYEAGDYVTAFAIVLNATAASDASYYLAISEKTSTSPVSSAGAVTVGFGSQANNTWAEIGTVPEPTSGLLLLIGMAGLALKRKQA